MSKILKIYLLERVYRKVSKIFYNKKFNSLVNNDNDQYLQEFFQSDSRSMDVLSDIKSKLKS